jgi:hypothetical protein
MAGVSRQAVSLWFKSARDGAINLDGKHLLSLSRALQITVEELASPLPCSSPEDRAQLQAEFLWDRLYPSLESFAIALAQESPKALARLVEVYGLFPAAKIAGRAVWSEFDEYKTLIEPARRQELERLWNLRQSLA